MRVFAYICLVFFCCSVSAAPVANPALLAGYVPGQATSFLFKLPPVSNLGSYNVELLLQSSDGVAGTDFFFDSTASVAMTSGYVFSSTDNFFASANALTGNRHSLTLSDFSLSGVSVIAGVNDGVATVVFQTSPSFNGVLSMSLGEDTFQLDTPETNPTSVVEFAAARNVVAEGVNVTVPPVPEPNSLVIAICSTCCAAFARRRWLTPLRAKAY